MEKLNIVIVNNENHKTLTLTTNTSKVISHYHKETSDAEMILDIITEHYGVAREEKIEALYDYIKNQEERYHKLRELYGYDHDIVKTKEWEVLGMEMAFAFLTGHNTDEHIKE